MNFRSRWFFILLLRPPLITFIVSEKKTRRLAAIMFTDIAGYTRLMQESEARANQLRQRHREVFEHHHGQYRGEILQYYGDGTLSIFDSCVDAVQCAIAMQQDLQSEPAVPLRIGIHLGDIVKSENDIYGDGVNLAARVESLGVPHAVLISEDVRKQVKNHEIDTVSMGLFEMKNVQKPMEVFAVQAEGVIVPVLKSLQGKAKRVKNRPSTRNWIGLLGLGVSMLLMAALLFRAFRTGKPDQVGAKSIREARVAAIPFENITGDASLEALGRMGAEWIISGLQTMNISSLTRETVEQHQSKLGILPNDPEGKPSFAEITGAQYAIMGSYYLVGNGDSLVLNTHVSSTETGEQIYTFPAVKAHIDNKENLVQEARQYILGFWGLKAEQKIPNINPPKYDAYKAILECTSWQFECFYKALSIDPDFLLARIRLMGACTSRSNDSLFYVQKAIIEKNLDRLTEYERAMFEMYSHAWEGDRTEKIKYISQLYQVDTNNWLPMQWLGYNLLADNRTFEAAEVFSNMFEKANLFDRQIGSLSYANFMEAHLRIQEYKIASDFYLDLTNENQTKAGRRALNRAIKALIYQNRLEEVHELIKEKGDKKAYLMAAYAYNFIFPEKKNPFFEDLKTIIHSFKEPLNRDDHPSTFFNFNSRALAFYVLKDWKNAELSLLKSDILEIKFDRPFTQFPDRDYWSKLWHTGMLGRVYAHLGNVEKSQAQIDQLDHLQQLYPKTNSFYRRGWVPYLKARIASILGDKELALELLNTSVKEGILFDLFRFHFDQDFLTLKGYPPFEAMLKPKDAPIDWK